MSFPYFRSNRWLALFVVLLIINSFVPSATFAQDPLPPTPEAVPTTDAGQGLDGQVIDPSDPTNTSTSVDEAVVTSDATSISEETSDTSLVDDSNTVLSSSASISTAAQAVVIQGVQGYIQLDVATPTEIRAGGNINYTYTYTNTSTSIVNNVTVQAFWNDFATSGSSAKQICASGTGVLCEPTALVGPAVSKQAACPTGALPAGSICYTIASLKPGEVGQFRVVLTSNANLYPQTGKSITVLSGSAKTLVGSSLSTISEDTASTLVAGPVLVLTKAAINPTEKVYVGEEATFELTVGNATGNGDKPSNQTRSDARTANNIVVVDKIPAGSEFVRAEPMPNEQSSTELKWNLNQPLAPGQTYPQKIRVTFKKINGTTIDCGQISNSTLTISSSDVRQTTPQPAISGVGASKPVVNPVVIKVISADPSPTVYGGQTTVRIVVQSFWNQPINNIQLSYDLQSNLTYAGSATPQALPTSTQTQVKWEFNMPAASKTTPVEKEFFFTASVGYVNATNTGQARLTVPNVPTVCPTRNFNVPVTPRLVVRKYTEADPETKLGGNYIVEKGADFEFIILVKNNGSAQATGLDINDTFPAALTYVGGSANIAPVPTAGGLLWDNLTIDAGQELEIRYKLSVDGEDYVKYCNKITAAKDDQEPIVINGNTVCVKINPQIEIRKIVDKPTANPGEEVKFTLTITNREATKAYTVGLYDALGPFTFVRQESGYGQATLLGDELKWPLVTLNPGDSRQVVFVAKVPTACVTKDYANEGWFHNDQNNIIQPIPRVLAKVRVNCGQVEYSIGGNGSVGSPISLQDRISYEIQLRNTDSKPASNVTVVNQLPPAFSFVGMESGGNVSNAPSTREITETNQLELTWSGISIPANTTYKIKYVARSGSVVGTYQNLVRITEGGKCLGTCVPDVTGNLYSTHSVKVEPQITLEPTIAETGCAQPGSTRTYTVKLVNRNDHSYANTVLNITLPQGLTYVKSLNSTPPPSIFDTGAGQRLTWRNLTVPAKPSGQVSSDMVFTVELQVGDVIGYLNTLVDATSTDGLIPRKEGVVDPTVLVCLTEPALAKTADKRLVQPNSEVIYQILLANPKSTPFTATVEDTLPAGLVYVEYIGGTNGVTPQVSGSTLRWTNITVPAASGNSLGVVYLKFKVRVPSSVVGTSFTNTAELRESSVTVDTKRKTAVITIARNIFLPVIGR